MADTDHARREARRIRASLRRSSSNAAQGVLDLVANEAKLRVANVGAGDDLLAGAKGVLDSESRRIYVSDGLPEDHRNLVVAHELGHQFLHGGVEAAPFAGERALPGDQDDAEYTGGEAAYSPQARDERDADAFALELLAPSDELLKQVVDGSRGPEQLAAEYGITRAAVYRQLTRELRADLPPEAKADVHPADDSQRAAARQLAGPVIVDAGPGTGKTATLALHILELVTAGGYASSEIAALTFTNRAAEELRERLGSALGADGRRVWAGTFHMFALELLAKHGPRGRPRVIGTADQVDVLRRRIADLPPAILQDSGSVEAGLRRAVEAIHVARDRGRQAADLRTEAGSESDLRHARWLEAVACAWQVLDEVLPGSDGMDMHAVIPACVAMLRESAETLSAVRGQYRRLVVDEAQDLDHGMVDLLALIADDGQGLWCVGDDRQSIYGFRGAAGLQPLRQAFSASPREVALTTNYRSVGAVVNLLNAIDPVGSAGRPWRCNRTDDGTARWYTVPDEAAEAACVAHAVHLWTRMGIEPADIAVLCRTNAQVRTWIAELARHGIAAGGSHRIEHSAVARDLVALLRISAGGDGRDLLRVLSLREFGGKRDPGGYPQTAGWLREQATTLLEDRDMLPTDLLPAAGRVADFLACAGAMGACDFVRYALFENPRLAAGLVADGVGGERAIAADLLDAAVRDDHGEDAAASRRGFADRIIEAMRLQGEHASRDARISRGSGRANVLTQHAAKGLEFRAAALVGTDEAIEGDDPGGPEHDPLEAGRLVFVAASRARDHLLVTSATSRGGQPRRRKAEYDAIHATMDESDWESPRAIPVAMPSAAPEAMRLGELSSARRCSRQAAMTRLAGPGAGLHGQGPRALLDPYLDAIRGVLRVIGRREDPDWQAAAESFTRSCATVVAGAPELQSFVELFATAMPALARVQWPVGAVGRESAVSADVYGVRIASRYDFIVRSSSEATVYWVATEGDVHEAARMRAAVLRRSLLSWAMPVRAAVVLAARGEVVVFDGGDDDARVLAPAREAVLRLHTDPPRSAPAADLCARCPHFVNCPL